MKRNTTICLAIAVFIAVIFFTLFSLFKYNVDPIASIIREQVAGVQFALLPDKDDAGNFLYKGTIYHIFFHSLIVYPQLAFNHNERSQLFKDYMITRDQFEKILPQLYANNFVLIDINSIYSLNEDGSVERKGIYLPKGKKPLIISLDDISYYRTQRNSGMADKLVLDDKGNVATQITTPEGKVEVTRDGDSVPILDDFVALHPDFSIQGAKGLIAVTGFDGVLGYRTQAGASATSSEVTSAKKVIDRLKSTGWRFASHSYSHISSFSDGTISLESLKRDTESWNREVRPLVGDTNIFIGPFGQIFSPNDPRRQYLVSQGFKMFCAVGMDLYLHYFSNNVAMDRADVDGYRLTNSPNLLKKYFDPASL